MFKVPNLGSEPCFCVVFNHNSSKQNAKDKMNPQTTAGKTLLKHCLLLLRAKEEDPKNLSAA